MVFKILKFNTKTITFNIWINYLHTLVHVHTHPHEGFEPDQIRYL